MENQFDETTSSGQTSESTTYTGGTAPSYGNHKLKTNRSMILFYLFSILTLGIYGIYFFTKIGLDLNRVATPRDGRKTMHFCLVVFLFSWLTFGIVPLVWFTRMSGRAGNEARARGVNTSFGGASFWLWQILGSLIIVGPFVFIYKLSKTMNQIGENYNAQGR